MTTRKQSIPVSPNRQAGTGGDVTRLQRQFRRDCKPRVGIEVEVFITDRRKGRPLPLFQEIHDRLPARIQERTHGEFLACQIEYATRPHLSVADIRQELHEFAEEAGKAAANLGAKLSWQTVLPDWEFDLSLMRNCDRSRLIHHRLGDRVCKHGNVQRFMFTLAYRMRTPFVLSIACSVSFRCWSRCRPISPVMRSRNYEASSHRAAVWAHEFPTSGFPRMFGCWDGFQSHVENLVRARVIESQKDLYYFVRPTRHGTVEVRCCDLQNLRTWRSTLPHWCRRWPSGCSRTIGCESRPRLCTRT